MTEEESSKSYEVKEMTSVLANERTYAAWIRTGLASFVTGLGSEGFLEGVIPTHFVHFISMPLLVFSAFCFILGMWRYFHIEKRLTSSRVSGAPSYLLFFLGTALVFVVFVAIVGIWLI